MTPPSELSATWSRITGALQTIMSPEVYGLWFPKFSLLEDSGKALTLVCDDPMAALWVENSYTHRTADRWHFQRGERYRCPMRGC